MVGRLESASRRPSKIANFSLADSTVGRDATASGEIPRKLSSGARVRGQFAYKCSIGYRTVALASTSRRALPTLLAQDPSSSLSCRYREPPIISGQYCCTMGFATRSKSRFGNSLPVPAYRPLVPATTGMTICPELVRSFVG